MNRVALVLILLQAIAAPTPQPARGSASGVVGQTDEYSSYELLAPETGTFKETFEVSVTAPGARDYTDRILPGTEVVSESGSDGKIRLDFVNGRPDGIGVLIKGRRRPGP